MSTFTKKPEHEYHQWDHVRRTCDNKWYRVWEVRENCLILTRANGQPRQKLHIAFFKDEGISWEKYEPRRKSKPHKCKYC